VGLRKRPANGSADVNPREDTVRAILTSFPAASPDARDQSPTDAAAPRRQTLDQLVASCVRDANGDPTSAALLLEDRAKQNRRILAELALPYLADACWKAVRRRLDAVGGSEIDHDDKPPEPDTSPRLHALADSLLDFRLPSGILLRDAFRHDVEEAAHWYLSRARALQRRGQWLEAIAPLVPRATVVGQVLDERSLQAILDRSVHR
jgi:hypothetical protein